MALTATARSELRKFLNRAPRPGFIGSDFNGHTRPPTPTFSRDFSSSSSAAEVAPRRDPMGFESVGMKEYLDYRRSLYGEITHKAVLVDAAGTLLAPSQPMAQIYREIGEKYGVQYSEAEILNRYRRAYAQPWGKSRLRYYFFIILAFLMARICKMLQKWQVEAEKPNPTIFVKACELLGIKPEEAVHVGDDRRNDVWGARDAGCDAWLWGSDVHSFKEVAQRIGVQV
ncbi:uncharacterized protein LOC120158011 [Hibiscus syriacus]|uniref:uncharacterized protein LOC120158011 n=1 Tax=Hibiscus syriacus TaxID=106335 RepID=UPI0019244C4B|nr:uncharacterized protein LOC120158011 [Hibiscus syriacus]